jgi:hypothetical protein
MKRCDVCGFERDPEYVTIALIANGGTKTICRQCQEMQDLYAAIEKEKA